MTSKPMLSICIPTYNRAEYLDRCLKAIISQDGFDDQVEVVISDNCSTDQTQEVCLAYAGTYPTIRYFRNDENVLDKNFQLALQRGTGILRKLSNDTIIYRPGALRYMLKAATDNMTERPQVCFLSKEETELPQEVTNPEQYVDLLGVNMTWIRSIAFWEDDCEDLSVFSEYAHTNMSQVPFLMANFEKRGKAMVYPLEIMDMAEVSKKNLSYGLFNVFYTNFLGFIRKWVDEKAISEACYQRLRKKLLLEFFSVWVIEQKTNTERYVFSDENLPKLIRDAYWSEPYYLLYLAKVMKGRLGAAVFQRKGGGK